MYLYRISSTISATEEATSKKEIATTKSKEIEIQSKEISVEKAEADAELQEALPALEAAKEALSKLEKSDITEIRWCIYYCQPMICLVSIHKGAQVRI